MEAARVWDVGEQDGGALEGALPKGGGDDRARVHPDPKAQRLVPPLHVRLWAGRGVVQSAGFRVQGSGFRVRVRDGGGVPACRRGGRRQGTAIGHSVRAQRSGTAPERQSTSIGRGSSREKGDKRAAVNQVGRSDRVLRFALLGGVVLSMQQSRETAGWRSRCWAWNAYRCPNNEN